MRRALIISVADQGILSAQSLALGGILVWLGTPEQVGRFALATSLYFAFLTLQDSLAGAVLANRVYGRTRDEQERTIGQVSAVAAWLALGAVLATAVATFVLGWSWGLGAATAAMTVSGLLRELARAASIALSEMSRCFAMNASAAVLTMLLLLPLWKVLPGEQACLWAMALAHGGAALVWGPRLHLTRGGMAGALPGYRGHLGMGGWSLVIGVAAELRSRTFLFIVEAIRGLSATSAMHVGRMLTSPMSLISMAVGRVVLPRMALHCHRGETQAALDICRRVALLLTAMGVAYALVLFLAWPLIDVHLLKGRYPQVADSLVAWCVLTAVNAPVWCLHWLYRALDRFGELATVSVVNTVAVLAAMTCLVLPVPLQTAVVILLVGDVGFTVTLLLLLRVPGTTVAVAGPVGGTVEQRPNRNYAEKTS